MNIKDSELLNALEWTLEYIDALPKDIVLPTMPGFDRDYVNNLISDYKNNSINQPTEEGSYNVILNTYVSRCDYYELNNNSACGINNVCCGLVCSLSDRSSDLEEVCTNDLIGLWRKIED